MSYLFRGFSKREAQSHLSSELQVCTPAFFFYLTNTHFHPTGWTLKMACLNVINSSLPAQLRNLASLGSFPLPSLLSHPVSHQAAHFPCSSLTSPTSPILPSYPHAWPEGSLLSQFADISCWVLYPLPIFVIPGWCNLVNSVSLDYSFPFLSSRLPSICKCNFILLLLIFPFWSISVDPLRVGGASTDAPAASH